MEQREELLLEYWREHLERTMLGLSPTVSIQNHSHYLAGQIDLLCDIGLIQEDLRATLYAEYAM